MKRILRLSSFKKHVLLIFAAIFFLTLGVFISSSWAAFNSTLPDNTVYSVQEFESGFHNGNTNAWGSDDELKIARGQATFMSDGTFSVSFPSKSNLNRRIGTDQNGHVTFSTTPNSTTDSVTGTYAISSDGTVTLTVSENGGQMTVTGNLSEDGQMFTYGIHDYSNSDMSASCTIGVGVKKGSGFSSTLPDNTVYTVQEFESGFQGGNTDAWGNTDELRIGEGQATFMSDGTFSVSFPSESTLARYIGEDQNGGITFSTTSGSHSTNVNGTYTISADGSVTLNVADSGGPTTVSGNLSEDGKNFIFSLNDYSSTDMSASITLGMGVKKGSGFSSTLPDNTAYALQQFESGFRNGNTNAWGNTDQLLTGKGLATFMSNGTFTISFPSESTLERYVGNDQVGGITFSTTPGSDSTTVSGTYSVSSDGSVTLNVADSGSPTTVSGYLSEDGQSFTFGFGDYNSTDMKASFTFGVGVKTTAGASSTKNKSLSGILPLLLEDN